MSDSLIIVPTYNEKENIDNLVNAIFDLPHSFHVLFIDDNSQDGTEVVIKDCIKKYPGKIFLHQREGKLGLGTAYIFGFDWALKRGYEFIFEMDADFSHNPQDLMRLNEKARSGFDVVIGSRYVKGGRIVNWPFDRLALSYGASLYVRIITLMHIKDPTAGFVCYHAKALRQLDLNSIKFIGYAFQIEMKFAMKKLGFSVCELPITFIDRVYGESKISKGIITEAIWGVIKMKFFNSGKSYRKK